MEDSGYFNGMDLPPTATDSGWSFSDALTKVQTTADSLFKTWAGVQNLQTQAAQVRINGDVAIAQANAAGNRQLSGQRIENARTAATESVELARAQAYARSGGAITGSSMSSMLLPALAVLAGVFLVVKLAK